MKDLVAKLEALEREATPAPWPHDYCQGAVRHISRNVDQDAFYDGSFYGWSRYYDGPLIAASRNALPALLAELHRLWAVEHERKAPSPSTREIVVAKIQALALAKTIANFVSVNRAAERKAAQATGQTCEWFVSESIEIANRIENAIRDVENNNA